MITTKKRRIIMKRHKKYKHVSGVIEYAGAEATTTGGSAAGRRGEGGGVLRAQPAPRPRVFISWILEHQTGGRVWDGSLRISAAFFSFRLQQCLFLLSAVFPLKLPPFSAVGAFIVSRKFIEPIDSLFIFINFSPEP